MTPSPTTARRGDRQVESGNESTLPVEPDVIERARRGDWSVVLIGYKPAPRDWFPADLHGVKLLALASGGGQQGPTLAAAGASVTVFDNSPKQLEKDRLVAEREGLDITTVLGDMRDLSAFGDASFDLVFHPVSNAFCPELAPVWRECHRVLRPGGELLAGFLNPDIFIFDEAIQAERSELVVRHSLPYSDLTHLPFDERERLRQGAPLEWSHTLAEQIGEQVAAGFAIIGFDETPHHRDGTAKYMPGYYATRARKL